jgi:microsomal dipeptidase-like Zn-dependent dipeptidase
MDDKKAIDVLMKLLKKRNLSDEEMEAVLTALGVLDMAVLGQSRMKSIIKAKKDKRAKSIEPR